MDTQVQRENDMRERGQRRAERAQRRAIERDEAADTPAGVHPAKRAVKPLADAIRAFMADAYSGKAGRRHTAAKLLKGVDPELAAYVTVRAALGFAAGQKTLRSAAMYVTEMLEGELVAERFEQANEGLYRAVLRNAQARGLPLPRQSKAVDLANRHFQVVEKPWTLKQRLHLGTKLIELMIETIGIIEASFNREGRRLTVHRLKFTPEIGEWVRKYNAAAALTRPMLLPTVVPPKAWEGITGGAYYTPTLQGRGLSMVTKPFPGQLQALQEATAAGTMAPVYKGLNGLQATPWRINKRILAVMQGAWEGNLQGLPLPPREDQPFPEAPDEVRNDVKGGEHRRAWRRQMRAIHEGNAKTQSARFEFAQSAL